APMRLEDRPNPFLPAENPKLMKSMMRKYEDESEEAAEALKKIEDGLKDKFIAAKHLNTDAAKNLDNKRGDYLKALKDTKDPVFTAEERKSWTQARDRAQQLAECVLRYRPMAYSVTDV